MADVRVDNYHISSRRKLSEVKKIFIKEITHYRHNNRGLISVQFIGKLSPGQKISDSDIVNLCVPS